MCSTIDSRILRHLSADWILTWGHRHYIALILLFECNNSSKSKLILGITTWEGCPSRTGNHRPLPTKRLALLSDLARVSEALQIRLQTGHWQCKITWLRQPQCKFQGQCQWLYLGRVEYILDFRVPIQALLDWIMVRYGRVCTAVLPLFPPTDRRHPATLDVLHEAFLSCKSHQSTSHGWSWPT